MKPLAPAGFQLGKLSHAPAEATGRDDNEGTVSFVKGDLARKALAGRQSLAPPSVRSLIEVVWADGQHKKCSKLVQQDW